MTTSTIRRGVRVALLSAGLIGAPASLTAAPAAASSAAPPGATVLVSFVSDDLSWTPGTRGAVLAAASTWGRTLASAVPIRVRATAGTIGGSPYAYASPVSFVRAPGARPAVADDVFEPVALSNARSGADATPGQPHVEARFDLSRPGLYLGTDGRTPADMLDLESLALHEMGHGLGFVGSAGFGDPATIGRTGAPGTTVVPGSRTPFSYDRFTCVRAPSGTCTPLMSLADGSPRLAAAYQGGALYWSGPRATAANGGRRVQLYAPDVLQPGSSYVHLDETRYPGRNAVMTPFLAYGQAVQTPGPITRAMLADMGWPLAGAAGTPGRP